MFIFFLTSFFNNSIHQLVAVDHRCTFSMKNGRENRNNGNQEKGKEEKETLSRFRTKANGGRKMRPLSFLWRHFRASRFRVSGHKTARQLGLSALLPRAVVCAFPARDRGFDRRRNYSGCRYAPRK